MQGDDEKFRWQAMLSERWGTWRDSWEARDAIAGEGRNHCFPWLEPRGDTARPSPDTPINHQQVLLDREAWASSSVLRVSTRPECSEYILRELR